jgi:polyisoprenoid-binding protein YceI
MAWNTDTAHSNIEFAVRHMLVSTVKGRFTAFTFDAQIDEHDLTRSRGSVGVDLASVDTREPQRDGHLRSADFFDVERFPAMTFVVTSVERGGPDGWRVAGDLTIRDVTKPVVFDAEINGPVKDPFGMERIGLSAHAKLDRKEFGLTWNVIAEAGGLLVGDEVKATVEAEFTKAAAETAQGAPSAGATS